MRQALRGARLGARVPYPGCRPGPSRKHCQEARILLEHFRKQSIVGVSAHGFRLDQTSIPQDLQMVRNRRLASPGHLDEVAGAQLLIGQKRDYLRT